MVHAVSAEQAGRGALRDLVELICYEESVSREQSGKQGSAGEAAERARRRIRIVITTNFDRELESAFEAARKEYHVVIPVDVIEKDFDTGADERRQPDWLVRKVYWDEYNDRERTNELLDGRSIVQLLNTESSPLIVQLHGAPLESLRGISVASIQEHGRYGPSARLQHRLTWSDGDFILGMMFGDHRWPRDLRESLQLPRAFCFLGYPLGDDTSRLLLSNFLKPGDKQTGRYFLVDYPEDVLRHRFLTSLKVELWKEPIEQFVVNILTNLGRRPFRGEAQ